MNLEHSGFIGPFWYNDSKKKLITAKDDLSYIVIPPEKAENEDSYVLGNKAHFSVWTSNVSKENEGVDYKHYPRGRVVYFPQSRRFKIFADKCLPANVIEEVRKTFQTNDGAEVVRDQGFNNKENRLAKEGHYTCHLCRNIQRRF